MDVDSGASADCDGNRIPDECELAPVALAPAGDLAVGRIPRVIVAADFDGDGLMDLATGNQNSDRTSTISVLLHRSHGTFHPAARFDAGESLQSMDTADVDGDGDIDLVTANLDRVLVLENSGAGTFRRSTELAVARDIRFVAARDLNGDGTPDLVAVSSRTGTVSVFLNELAGSFGTGTRHAVGAAPTSVAAADLDGDGDADLAVSHSDSGDLSLLRGRGDGTFEAVVSRTVGGEGSFSVLADDLNGDHLTDLIVASSSGASLLFSEGTGGFGAPVLYAVSAISLASGDLDGDGDIDLALGSADAAAIIVLLNDGRGRFGSTDVWLPDVRWGLCAADLDGDGDLDLASSRVNPDRITVLRNGDEGALSFRRAATFPAGGDPHAIDLGDVDGDGHLDVVTANNNEGFSVITGNGDGTFARARIYGSEGHHLSITSADIDLDGGVDLASVDPRVSRIQVFRQSAGGDFDQVESYPIGGKPHHVVAGDLDADEFPDLVSANAASGSVSILFCARDGRFGVAQDIEVGSAPVACALADLEGDGDLDLAVANQGSSEIATIENRGDRRFSAPVVHAGRGRPGFVAAADLDLDGCVDLVTTSEADRSLHVFWNAGRGGRKATGFEPPVGIFLGRSPHSVTVADLHGDGRPELLTANPDRDTVSILVGKPDRLFASPVELPVGSQPRFVAAGDVDGNGTVDLISANHHSADITVLLNDSAGSLPADVDYLETICTEREFQTVSVPSARDRFAARVVKYVLPARDDARPSGAVFQNSRRYALHEEFLAAAWPERFAGITREDYHRLVGRRATRAYYVGAVLRAPAGEGGRYAFTVAVDTSLDAGEVLSLAEIQHIHERLSAAFRLAPLHYHPDTELARRELEETWPLPPPVPLYLPRGRSDITYEPYSLGAGYGRVRRLTLSRFEEADRLGRFTFQDIVVVDEAPRDVEGVVGGLITAQPQGELSHVAIRLARQGIPNAFVADARRALAPCDGQLVRLQVCEGGYTLDDEVSEAEAAEFWARNRPELSELPPPDETYSGLDLLLEIDTSGSGVVPVEARFGGKAANFARLQQVLTGDLERYREAGFAIPVRYYLEFLRTNFVAVGDRELTYEEHLHGLFASRDFRTDSVARAAALRSFRELARERGVVDPELVARLGERIIAVFGAETRMVRFRSSSNIEDGLAFNGAGLYESTSACAADTLRGRPRRGSHCDRARANARTIERALRKVWTSVWTLRAFEARSWFQIPQESAAMGILATRAFLDESANGVAFTGNPRDSRDRRYIITAQVGEASVASPDPGVVAERSLLEVAGGEVVDIVRARASSLVGAGEVVLSDAQLRELGELMWHVDRHLPIELEGRSRDEVLLDFEFKIEPDGSLAIKQVRPFLLPSATPASPNFELEIPPGTTVCGVFSKERAGRSLQEEHEAKSTVRFVQGTLELPAGRRSFAAHLFEEVRFGPGRALAEPAGPGIFRAARIPTGCGEATYRFGYAQPFSLPTGEPFELELFGLEFTTAAGGARGGTLRLDEHSLTHDLAMRGVLSGDPRVSYSSCTYELLPAWNVTIALEDGSTIRLVERFLPSENDLSTGPASLVRADIDLGDASQTVTDYWRLVYAAERHNRDPRYRIMLDPLLDVDGIGLRVRAVEVATFESAGNGPAPPEPGAGARVRVSLLGEDFERLETRAVVSFRRSPPGEERSVRFRRGDVSSDGAIDRSDAIRLLEFLLLRGPPLACAKAADADDNGRLNLSDAVVILAHIYRGGDSLPEPVTLCGVDATPDALGCKTPDACRAAP